MFFKIYSANFCLLIGEFRLLTCNVIIEMLRLKSDIVLFIFCLLPIFHSSLFFLLPPGGLLGHFLELHFFFFRIDLSRVFLSAPLCRLFLVVGQMLNLPQSTSDILPCQVKCAFKSLYLPSLLLKIIVLNIISVY